MNDEEVIVDFPTVYLAVVAAVIFIAGALVGKFLL
jgi:hypothetical protein